MADNRRAFFRNVLESILAEVPNANLIRVGVKATKFPVLWGDVLGTKRESFDTDESQQVASAGTTGFIVAASVEAPADTTETGKLDDAVDTLIDQIEITFKTKYVPGDVLEAESYVVTITRVELIEDLVQFNESKGTAEILLTGNIHYSQYWK